MSAGFPSDYLVARVRGRRAALVKDWRGLIETGAAAGVAEEESWGGLLRELDWVHRQMEQGLRETFAAVFVLFELKTIVLCLRNRSVENATAAADLLRQSLLSDDVKDALREPGDVQSTIAELAGELAVAGEAFGHLGAVYAKSGLRGFEDGLLRAFSEVATGQQHGAIDDFLVTFVDLRNVMILFKHLHWEMGEPAPFLTGGRIEGARLARILARRSQPESDFDRLVQELTGLARAPAAEDQAGLETVLLRTMTDRLRKAARESEDVGVILDYLWRVYVQARNLAVLHHAADLSAERLERELIT